MRRHDFITLLITLLIGAVSWSFAHAQPSTMPVIGFLHPAVPAPFERHVAAFKEGLSERWAGRAGFVEGRDVKIE